MTRCAIVIPAFREEGAIGGVVTELSSRADVIVVDDASPDGTADVAAAAGATVVRRPVNAGYGAASDAIARRRASSHGRAHALGIT